MTKQPPPEGKFIPGFSAYIATRDGRIYSTKTNIFLKPYHRKDGYLSYSVTSDDDKKKKKLIQDLMVLAYIDENFVFSSTAQVNHMNGKEKENNSIENLEITTASGNVQHAFDTGLKVPTNQRKVCQLDKDTGEIINTFDSEEEASRETGIDHRSISYACTGKNRTGGGYGWCFYEDRDRGLKPKGRGKYVDKLDENGDIIDTYNMIEDAVKDIRCDPNNLRKAIKNKTKFKGYFWQTREKGKIIFLTKEQENKISLEQETSDWVDMPDFPGYKICEETTQVYDIKNKALLKPFTTGGYLLVNIRVDGKRTQQRINRLVGMTFIPNPNNYPMVLYKTRDTTNNHIENLFWGNESIRSKTALENGHEGTEAVIQYDLEGNELAKFASIADAVRATGESKEGIIRCCKGRNKTTSYKYKWEYDNDE